MPPHLPVATGPTGLVSCRREGAAMYGTIARLRLKPGREEQLQELLGELRPQIPGLIFDYLYHSDEDPLEYYLVVGFSSHEAYQANATSPEQHTRYERYRPLLEAEPEWHDGEIVISHPT
jgi:quinol monooxygenase YgiN